MRLCRLPDSGCSAIFRKPEQCCSPSIRQTLARHRSPWAFGLVYVRNTSSAKNAVAAWCAVWIFPSQPELSVAVWVVCFY